MKTNKVSILGADGSFSSNAWKTYAEINEELSTLTPAYCGTIKNCFEAVDIGAVDTAIAPLLNSTRDAAWVAETLNGLKEYDARICGEVELPIEHCLVVLPEYDADDGSKITEVLSKDKALQQCLGNLKKYCSQAEQIPVDSTSDASKYLLESGDTSCAAIIPKSAAEKYRSDGALKIISYDLQDEQDNRTRFVVLGKESSKPTGDDKTTVIFRFENMGKSGLLYNLLEEFADREISLAYMQTIPNLTAKPNPETRAEYNGTQLEFEFSGAKESGLLYDALGVIAEKDISMSYIQSIPNGDLNNVSFICDLDADTESEQIENLVNELNGFDSIKRCEAKSLPEKPPQDLTFYMDIFGHRDDKKLLEALEMLEISDDFALWKVCGSYPVYQKNELDLLTTN
ncbi:MAG: hypothetical protein KAJ91_04545 [Candidatus Aenigmarchaeota archaeon]|nr:hypothetical protein [Candidatus Aenigmarchaeota archaeon]